MDSSEVGGWVGPDSRMILHFPQLPLPPHSEDIRAPAVCEASRMVVPAGTWVLLPAGSKVTVGYGITIPLKGVSRRVGVLDLPCLFELVYLLSQGWQDLEEVVYDAIVRNAEYRCFGVLVDGDDEV